MKSLLHCFTGRSSSQSSRPTRRFQPRFQALESRLLLAGPDIDADIDAELPRQERVDGEQADVATTHTDSQAELLEQLRRLQDLQITIEVRFITLQDKFFEQIGVDFDFDVDDNGGLSVDAVSQADLDPDTVVDPDPSGNATRDLIFGQNTFGSEVPDFGGFDPTAGNIGFAVLSDIEVFFLIHAAKGDARSNLQQAPAVTMFNGQ